MTSLKLTRSLFMVFVMTALWSVATMAASPSSSSPTVLRVVVTDLERTDDIPERMARLVADDIVAELRKLQGLTVVSMDEVRAMLAVESDRQMLGCSEESSSCLAELADALGADIVIGGGLSTVGDTRVFSLRRLDQRRAVVAGTVDERLVAANGEEFLAAIGPAIEKLFPDAPLRIGATRGVPPERARLLNPPPVPSWATITVGVVAVVAAAAGGASLLLAQRAVDDGQALVDASSKDPVDGALVVKQEQTAQALNTAGIALLGGSVIVAATAGIMAVVTDWTNASAGE